MTTSSSSKEGASGTDSSIHNPEDVLNNIGTHNKRLVAAIVSCSFSWGFGALSIMSSALTSIDYGNCTDTMLTVTDGLRYNN
ncbi:unnamed protein product [Cylicocyclus nassatus]|uniref:Uncharacterized protein n=1 Tax=Cylicocyclus nassatus TaxID=53992 RepID=A0AA36MFF2_CYLNA|nr:unnamed protein product [Cylicocyclus nassatus]